ncbi:hypothetical protein F2P56_030704 [Juglans regia]|uniref:Retrovirus-related Pol polyprotein from transposon RE2 n=1 Tax=Juglans regia TaxID=51240 RepID=A0A833UE26_JUGRE|nr:hypothetical protein F2P56_030704 [Juglans regia]
MFEEFHDLLFSHEAYLHRLEMLQQTTFATANYHQKKALVFSSHRASGHTTRQCKKFWTPPSSTANCAATGSTAKKSWVVDFGASHHVTSDMSKLSIHSEYDGTDEHKYVRDLLYETGMDGAKDFTTPLATFSRLQLNDGSSPALAQFMHSPSEIHWIAVKRLLRYLKHSIYHEYRALVSVASEIAWLQSLFCELGVTMKSPPKLLCDNIGATQLSLNPVLHSQMKHVAIDLHFVQDYVNKGILQVAHVSTHDQLADLMTKALSHPHFQLLRSKIGVTGWEHHLEGA